MSSTAQENLVQKMKIMEACLEGARARMEEYNPNDEVFEGLLWAFYELKEELSEFSVNGNR